MSTLSLSTQAIHALDKVRFSFLRILMWSQFMHHLYATRPLRLSLRFIFLTVLTLPVAFYFPAVLLIGGPILFGYLHLIASCRYSGLSAPNIASALKRKTMFHCFAIATLCSLTLRLVLEKTSLMENIPFGVWEVGVATLLFFFWSWKKKLFTLTRCLMASSLCAAMLYFAFWDPLIFTGAVLIMHNWVAMIYWITVAPTKWDKAVALLATTIFGAIHFLVMRGYLDHVIQIPALHSPGASEVRGAGWIIAPWSQNPIIWARAVVIYTYGLSIHYFAWLSAIPECHSPRQYPNSFRMTFRELRQDLGRKTCFTLLGITVLGTGLWFFSYDTGKNIYFSLATLHGWIEILFLLL